jgi:hypothetical protein
MASSFPGAIDSFTDPLSGSPLNSPSHSAQHADLNDAVEKIETYALNLPRGVVGKTSRVAGNLTVGPAVADLTGMTVTFTAVAGRAYRATWSGGIQKISTSGWSQITFADSANATYAIAIAYTVAGSYANLSGSALITGLTAGSKTFKLRLQCEANTVIYLAEPTGPAFLIIEDIGLA